MSDGPLVIFHKQLGDLLLLEPALAKLAAASGRRVTLSTRSAFLPMISLMNQVDGVSGLQIRTASEVIAFSGRFHPSLKAILTFAPKKRLSVTSPSQVKRWHPWLYKTGIHSDSRWNLYRARYFFEVMPCEETFTFRPPILNIPPSGWLPSNLPKKYVQVHTTSAWPHKSWPAEHWAETLTALDKQGIGPFVLTGGSTEWEQEFVKQIERRTHAPVLNLCGKTPLKAYIACVANADMVLCIDGSATHLASAFNRRSLTLFGPSDPTSWHHPSDSSAIINGREYSPEPSSALMSAIPVEAVLRTVANILDRNPAISPPPLCRQET